MSSTSFTQSQLTHAPSLRLQSLDNLEKLVQKYNLTGGYIIGPYSQKVGTFRRELKKGEIQTNIVCNIIFYINLLVELLVETECVTSFIDSAKFFLSYR